MKGKYLTIATVVAITLTGFNATAKPKDKDPHQQAYEECWKWTPKSMSDGDRWMTCMRFAEIKTNSKGNAQQTKPMQRLKLK